MSNHGCQPAARDKVHLWPMLLLGGGVLALLTLVTPLSRTQESRVLECGREMMHQPVSGWLVPQLNGNVRLHKPPLAYWLAASSFNILGVSTWAGRLPFALAGLATVMLVHAAGCRLGGRRTGTFAAGTMISMLMFQRYARLAETDVLVLLCLTAAAYALVRAAQFEKGVAWGWHHLAAVAMAGAAMSKGPPAAFVLLLLPAVAWAMRRWRIVFHWFISGAPLTAAALGAPWWLFALYHPQASTIAEEAKTLAMGADHGAPFHHAIGYVIKGAVPWTAWLAAAAWATLRRGSVPAAVRVALGWALTLGAVHMVLPQKQEHYMLPLAPPLALLGGWALDNWLTAARDRLHRLGGLLLVATAGLTAAAALAVAVAAPRAGGRMAAVAAVVAVAGGVAAAGTLALAMRRGATSGTVTAMLAATSISMAAIITALAIERRTMADVVYAIRQRYGDGPYAFYILQNVPLLFEMRRTIPVIADDAALLRAAAARPGLVVICETGRDRPAAPPAPFTRAMHFPLRKTEISVYLAPATEQ